MSAPLTPCGCVGCAALVAECGPAMFPFYARKLLIDGWAGSLSEAEREYRKAHVSAAKAASYARAAARLSGRRRNADSRP